MCNSEKNIFSHKYIVNMSRMFDYDHVINKQLENIIRMSKDIKSTLKNTPQTPNNHPKTMSDRDIKKRFVSVLNFSKQIERLARDTKKRQQATIKKLQTEKKKQMQEIKQFKEQKKTEKDKDVIATMRDEIREMNNEKKRLHKEIRTLQSKIKSKSKPKTQPKPKPQNNTIEYFQFVPPMLQLEHDKTVIPQIQSVIDKFGLYKEGKTYKKQLMETFWFNDIKTEKDIKMAIHKVYNSQKHAFKMNISFGFVYEIHETETDEDGDTNDYYLYKISHAYSAKQLLEQPMFIGSESAVN